jgi:Na+-translocating ferredoxin:NAD+ oxidoreductase RnfC subunit
MTGVTSTISLDSIAEAGVVGAGGAGFPTAVKLSTRAEAVLLNAAECEPLLHKDKEVLHAHLDAVVEGVRAAMRLTGAKQGHIGIKEKYHALIDELNARVTGGIKVAPLRDAYPAGDEFILVYDILKRAIPPGGLPRDVGAVVLNVETALNVARSADTPVIDTYLSVAGAVREPLTLRVPVGARLIDCIQEAGGATVPDPHYMVGGVMMGQLEPNISHYLVEKRTAGVVVLPGDHVVIRRRQQDWTQIARIGRSACDQCSFCTELCPRWLLGHPIEPHKAMRSLGFNLVGEANVIGTSFCCECNLCSLYACPEDLDPRNVCVQNKRRLAADRTRWTDPPFATNRAATHLDNRKAPMKRLMQKLGLTAFSNVGPLKPGRMEANRVGIPLKQHVGEPCAPIVEPGQTVAEGQVVGRPPVRDGRAALGAPVHASIAGTVTGIHAGVVWISPG